MRYRIKNISNGYVTIEKNHLMKKGDEAYRFYSKVPDHLEDLKSRELIEITPIGVEDKKKSEVIEEASTITERKEESSVPTPPSPPLQEVEEDEHKLPSPPGTDKDKEVITKEKEEEGDSDDDEALFTMKKFIKHPMDYNRDSIPPVMEFKGLLEKETRYTLVKIAYAMGIHDPMKNTKDSLVTKIIEKL